MAHASRHAARALTAICLGAAGTTVLTAAPALAAPSVDQAQHRVDKIGHDRKAAIKRATTTRQALVHSRLDLSVTRARLSTYRAALAEVEQRLEEMASTEGDVIGRALTAASTVTTAPDPAAALDEAQAEMTEDREAPATAASLEQQLAELRAAQGRQAARVQMLTTRFHRAGDHLEDVKRSLARANAALHDAREAKKAREAEAAARAAETSATPDTVASAPVAVSGGAAAAVAYALAQVGDAYVYGAAGPSAFDCSGLMMAAWAQAGVGLPHSSSAQMGSGTPVSISALQPGDLVFYYSPVSHVGMYIGNGQIVHAANPGSGVLVSSVSSMPISGAVRPG